MNTILTALAVIFAASALTAFWTIYPDPGRMTTVHFTATGSMIGALAGGIIYYIIATGIVEYYGINETTYGLLKEKTLTKRHLHQFCRVSGSLQKCCNFMNKNNLHQGYHIIDDEGHLAGVKENGQWKHKWQHNASNY